jgi:hypothetical protein
MPLPDNMALFGAAGCGCHQQVLGAIVVGGEEIEPLVFLDFKNGAYVSDGESKALGDLVGPNIFGQWDESYVVNGTGLVGPVDNASCKLIGDAADLIIAGATFVCGLSVPSIPPGVSNFAVSLAVFGSDFDPYYQASFIRANFNMEMDDSYDKNVKQAADLLAGSHKVAVTIVSGRMAASIDGQAVVTAEPCEPWDGSQDSASVDVVEGSVVEYVGLYPAQDDADLPLLSAL